MKRVSAHLAPLLTSPCFALWHILGAILCLPALGYAGTSADATRGDYIAVFVLPAWSAFLLFSLQRDLLTRPLVFCLPGHRDVLCRVSFLVGGVASLVAVLPILTYPELGGWPQVSIAWSSFCFGGVVFFGVAGSLFLVPTAVSSFTPFVLLCVVLLEFGEARLALQRVALFAPGGNTLALAALSVFAWRQLGSVELARRNCGRRFLALHSLWQRGPTEELAGRKKIESLARGGGRLRQRLLERCFARIGRQPMLSLRRHLAAVQFELAGRVLPASAWSPVLRVLLALAILTLVGYAPPTNAAPHLPVANVLYLGSCGFGLCLLSPVLTPILLPAGRCERFWSTLITAGAGGIVVLVLSLLIYSVFRGLSASVPELFFAGNAHPFRPADLDLAFVPVGLLPLSIILRIVCRRWLLIPEILLFGATALFIVHGGAVVMALPPVAIVAAISLCWALLIGALYFQCFRRDLA